jgi:hypothetical protein
VELLEGPREIGDSVWIKGRAIYTAAGAPDLAFDLEETAHFAGERIRLLTDVYSSAEREKLAAYVGAHGARIGLRL